MNFMGWGKKKDSVKSCPACVCHDDAPAPTEAEGRCCPDGCVCTIESVKVLGAGCKRCHELYENCVTAVKELDLPVVVEYVTDMEKIVSYGVMSVPAFVVNEKVVSSGKVMSSADVVKLLKKLGYC